MSNDIKVGDLCEIVGCPVDKWNGLQCEVVGPAETVTLWYEWGAIANGVLAYPIRFEFDRYIRWSERKYIRKKPPKQTDDAEPRLELVPAIADDWQHIGWTPNKTKEPA